MAYAAVACLKTTIIRLLNSSRISIISTTRKIMKSVYEELGSLQELLEITSSSRLVALDGQIIRAVQKLEDFLERHELNQLHSQSQSYGDIQLMNDIISSTKEVKNIKQLYKNALGKSLPEEAKANDNDYDKFPEEEDDDEKKEDEEDCDDDHDDDDNVEEEEKGVDGDGNGFFWNTVGLSKNFYEIRRSILEKRTYVVSIIGMAGIGKTVFAKRIFHDPLIVEKFECRAFCKIGQDYQLESLKQDILAQANRNDGKLPTENDKRLNDEHLKQYLDDKSYLIVLDDVWSEDFWYEYFKDRRGDKAKGSCILLTTRLEDLASSLGDNSFFMPFFDKHKSWDLLRMKMFADEECPREFIKIGKEIAEMCDGLPLMIVTIANILSKLDMTEENWKEAANRKSVVFQNAYDQILEVLYPSYDNLPVPKKACFLYMAAFPPDHEVRRSKLVNLWCTEGFLEPFDSTTIQSFASECFDTLIFDNTVVPANQLSSDGQTYQACSLHSVFRHLCRNEIKNNEFLHITQSKEDGLSTQGKRRVCIYYNALLSIKDVCTSKTRSLLCTGAYHKYEVGIEFQLMKLLKVCDVLTIRFFEFPTEVLMLVLLKYLAITCNRNLPSSISKLWKLDYLIVHKHLSINTTVAETYLPVEIWDLQELIHLEIMGRNLPNPPSGVKLEKLVTLLDVGIYSCTEGVLNSIPNLEKLRVQIELTPDSTEPPLSNLDNISQLGGLLSLQCVIVNPTLSSEIYAASVYPSSVTKLTLSGFGYPWENMNPLAKLPHLKVLKLLCYAFQGEIWEVDENNIVFSKLECLSIEDSDLVHWKVGQRNFPSLSHLHLKCCYNLQQFSKLSSIRQIKLVDCGPLALTCANQMGCYVICSCSWDAANDHGNELSTFYQMY